MGGVSHRGEKPRKKGSRYRDHWGRDHDWEVRGRERSSFHRPEGVSVTVMGMTGCEIASETVTVTVIVLEVGIINLRAKESGTSCRQHRDHHHPHSALLLRPQQQWQTPRFMEAILISQLLRSTPTHSHPHSSSSAMFASDLARHNAIRPLPPSSRRAN